MVPVEIVAGLLVTAGILAYLFGPERPHCPKCKSTRIMKVDHGNKFEYFCPKCIMSWFTSKDGHNIGTYYRGR